MLLDSPASLIRDGIHDEPLICPAIGGDWYRAAIPPLQTESESSTDVGHLVGLGLPIPFMWVHHGDFGTKFEQNSANHCNEHDESTSNESTSLENKTSSGTPHLKPSETKGRCQLPGSPAPSWSDDETQSFLLGLYSFGKDLAHVKEFIECKKMEDILAYFYGRFYKSEAFRRWSRRVFGNLIRPVNLCGNLTNLGTLDTYAC